MHTSRCVRARIWYATFDNARVEMNLRAVTTTTFARGAFGVIAAGRNAKSGMIAERVVLRLHAAAAELPAQIPLCIWRDDAAASS